MRLVTIFGLLLLAFLFHCGDAKAETADNIQFVSLDEVKGKMAAKEDFYLLIGRLDNVDTQNALDRLSQIDQVIYCLDTMTHLAHFRGKYQFAVANVLTADLAGFFAV